MYIAINGTYLTNDGSGSYTERQITPAHEFTLNGKRLSQIAHFLRATAAQPFDRGNITNTLRFKVTRGQGYFATLAAAEAFVATHFSNLPGSGPLLIVCGLTSDPQLLATATVSVLEAVPTLNYLGISVTCEYSLTCGLITSGALPATINIDCGTV